MSGSFGMLRILVFCRPVMAAKAAIAKKTNAFMFYLNNILLFLETKLCTAVLQLFKYFIFLKLFLCTISNVEQNVTKSYRFLDLYVYYYLLIESKSKNVIK